MNRYLTAVLPLALTSTLVSADWYIQPKVGYEMRDFGLRTTDSDNMRINASIPGTILGFSFINSAGYYWGFEFSGGNSEASGFYPEDDFIERFDTTLSAGYSLGDGVTIFGGFATSDTQLENSKEQPNEPGDFQTVSSGLFIGLSQNFNSQSHSFSIAAALGRMEGTYQSDGLDAGGTSIGLSGSLSYTYRLSSGLALTAGIKGQNYSYSDMINDQTGLEVEPLNESITSYFLKTSYTF
jgi:hypothetical protein